MELMFFLSLGTIFMLIAMLHYGKKHQIMRWKTVISTLCLTLSGVLGTKIMYWIETGRSGGLSFFGAIFLIPLLMSLIALVLRIPVGTLLDMCALAECLMLAIMKLSCLYSGCCKGRVLYESNVFEIRFPSQIVEMITILVIFLVLTRSMRKNVYSNEIYAQYMILYGSTRFVLNILRDTKPFVWILPAGNFWSLISISIGILWILLIKKNQTRVLRGENE